MVTHGSVETSLADLAIRVRRHAAGRSGRFLLGIAGPPGAGKSTLARGVCQEIDLAAGREISAVAPMDGFHLPIARLRELGLLDRKGEPGTFDAEGYVTLLRALRGTPPGVAVPWPAYDRRIHEPVPGAIVFDTQTIVVTEGNYLLLEDPAHPDWSAVRGLLDEVWYLDVPRPILEERLLRRHIRGGRTHGSAKAKVARTDMPNALLVESTRSRADIVLRKSGRGYRID